MTALGQYVQQKIMKACTCDAQDSSDFLVKS